MSEIKLRRLEWSRAQVSGKVTTAVLRWEDSAAEVATLHEEHQGAITLETPTGRWQLTRTAQDVAATAPSGEKFSARGDREQLSGSKIVNCELAGRSLTCINEAKSDWVIEDSTGQLVAQFTGANHAVRTPALEVYEGTHLNPNEQLFLAWLARVLLEDKMLSVTKILTWSLLALAPFCLLVYLF